MSQHIEGPRKTFTAGTALNPNLRVKITSADGAYGPTVGLAGATDPCIGVVEEYAASGAPVTVYLANAQGTRKMSATAVAITANNPVYAAASGQVASTGTVVEGKALESTGGSSGDLLEVLPTAYSDISTAISGTTNATFEVDTDSSAPKIGFAPNTGGTGDFTTWLTTEATLSADNTITVPESNGDTLMACGLAQTVSGAKTMTGNLVMSGAVDLQFTGTTGQSEIVITDGVADGLSIKRDTTDMIVFDTTTPKITITPATDITGLITSAGGITISGAVDLTFSGTTGQPEIVVPDNVADALSVKDDTGGADLMVFTTTNGSENVHIPCALTCADNVASGTAKRVGGLAYCLAAAGTAHTNSTDEAVLASYELPANSIKAGTVVKIRYQGIATAQAGATTLTVNLRIGPTTLTGTVVQTHAAHAITENDIFAGEFTLVGRATPGAAAACVGFGMFGPTADAYDADGTLGFNANMLASTNFATNGALKIELCADWSAADASSCRCDIFIVEVI